AFSIAADAVAEQIAGEHGVAEPGVAAGLGTCVLVEPRSAVQEQHAGADPVGRVVEAKKAGAGDLTAAVGNRGRGDGHPSNVQRNRHYVNAVTYVWRRPS